MHVLFFFLSRSFFRRCQADGGGGGGGGGILRILYSVSVTTESTLLHIRLQ